MVEQWVLISLLAVQERLEADGAAEQLRIMSGMSDDELMILARLEAGAERGKPSAPASLDGLLAGARFTGLSSCGPHAVRPTVAA